MIVLRALSFFVPLVLFGVESIEEAPIKSRLYLFSSQSENLFEESEFVISTSTSIPDVRNFTPVAECSAGVWTFFGQPNYNGSYKGFSPFPEIRCLSFDDEIGSARFHGNTSDILQPSVTFFPQAEFIGEPDGPYFTHTPEFEGEVTSLVLTGKYLAVRLFTEPNYGGLEYCVHVEAFPGFIGAVFDNIPEQTGFPPDIFKSFIMASNCFERVADSSYAEHEE